MNTLGAFAKRSFDTTGALAGLLCLSPLLALIALAIGIASSRPILFGQTRVGRHGQLFRCLKFRTMRTATESQGTVTTAADSRITPLGRMLRNWKLDELPQLWNVFKGDMSFVGPRPDVPGYADRLHGADRVILELAPGITGPATLLFRYEEQLLASVRDPQIFNDAVIYPEKRRLNLTYRNSWSFGKDLGYMLATVAPAVSKRTGLDRILGLDYEAFSNRMNQAAAPYRA